MVEYYKADSYKIRDSIGYLVRRAGNLMTTRVEDAFAGHDITFAQWIVLMNLRDGVCSNAAEIARGMCHDSGALTRLIDQLAQRGLIERSRSQADRRSIVLKLTDAGHAKADALLPLVVGLLNTALTDFTQDETQTLIRLLTKLLDGISAFEPECSLLEKQA